ncbi:hypothetical protein Tcan_02537 [Toxocara canis]|uniref:AMP-dependent synthetase/ligase domain-containing protein n=1 Tax=Toxocara canis TaxID=6265 RepID=A0A0B2UP68_TOXCA|nr:hypothetical protein Tcan_02537 [Toxocara canis]
MRGWIEMCANRLREIGVNNINSRVAVITSTTGQALFVHFGCSLIGAVAVCINGFLSVDEIWQQVDISESTHAITESQFLSKVEEVKRKAIMRGGSRIKVVKLLDDVLSDVKLKKDGGATKRPSTIQQTTSQPPANDASPPIEPPQWSLTSPESSHNEDESEQAGENGQMPGMNVTSSKQTLLIFFSSGTTGLIKAVEISHRSLIVNIQQISCPIYGPPAIKERFLLSTSY